MRAVLQRVRHARVTVDAKVVGEIGPGLLVFLGVGHEDSQADGQWLAEKIAILRIVPDEHGHMNRSLREVAGDALVVSQFTLYARTRKGPRPSFKDAALPALAQPLYQTFLRHLSSALAGKTVASGEFGARMAVDLLNDGPVTLVLDTKQRD